MLKFRNQLICFLLLSFNLLGYSQDSLIRYRPVYTKAELKKEKKDLTSFSKMIRSLEKSFGGNNFDFMNNNLEKVKKFMDQKNMDLNQKISDRSIKIHPPKVKNKDTDDLPKGYNTNIDGQIKNLDKDMVAEKRSETAILMKYSQILNRENAILRKLKNFNEISQDVSKTSLDEILKDSQGFLACMKDAYGIMTREKGKKVRKKS